MKKLPVYLLCISTLLAHTDTTICKNIAIENNIRPNIISKNDKWIDVRRLYMEVGQSVSVLTAEITEIEILKSRGKYHIAVTLNNSIDTSYYIDDLTKQEANNIVSYIKNIEVKNDK